MFRESSGVSIMIAFLIGGLVGASTMLFLAPQSGAETRELIRDKGMELKDKALTTAENTRERAEKAIDDVASTTKEQASRLKDRSQKIIERGK